MRARSCLEARVTISSSDLIPKEQLSAFQRWELASLQDDAVAAAAAASTERTAGVEAQVQAGVAAGPAAAAASTERTAEVEAQVQPGRDAARAEGHDEGYAAGYAAGFAAAADT